LSTIKYPKHPKKGKTRNKMQGPTFPKKTNELPKRVNHKSNIKFPNPPPLPIARSISNKKIGRKLWLRKMASKYTRKFFARLYMVRKNSFLLGFYFPSELTIVVSIVVSSVACVGRSKEPLPM